VAVGKKKDWERTLPTYVGDPGEVSEDGEKTSDEKGAMKISGFCEERVFLHEWDLEKCRRRINLESAF